MTAVMDRDAMARALRRIAHEIIESAERDDVPVLLGIPTRGVPIARRLEGALGALGLEVHVGVLDTASFRDDVPATTVSDRTQVPVDVSGRTVVLVDDVLYTGRTIRAALDALVTLGRPARVRVAVLVDRGHRELPIRADHVGKNLPTARDQRVSVRLDEVDGREGVWIESVAVGSAAGDPELATGAGGGR